MRHRKCALVVWIEYLSERKIMDESYCEFEREREGDCEFVIVHEKEIMREIEYIRSRDRQIKYT